MNCCGCRTAAATPSTNAGAAIRSPARNSIISRPPVPEGHRQDAVSALRDQDVRRHSGRLIGLTLKGTPGIIRPPAPRLEFRDEAET